MVNDEFKEKKINIFGTGGSGKTEFSKNLWTHFNCPLAFDLNGDFKNCKGGVAFNPSQNIRADFEYFIKELYPHIDSKKKVDAIFFDDADAYIDYELMGEAWFNDLIIRQRNKFHVSLVFISKRPQNLPTKIVENAHTLIIYKMEGSNAIKRLNDIDERITPLLDKVYLKDYSYILKIEGKPPVLKSPLKI